MSLRSGKLPFLGSEDEFFYHTGRHTTNWCPVSLKPGNTVGDWFGALGDHSPEFAAGSNRFAPMSQIERRSHYCVSRKRTLAAMVWKAVFS